METSTASSPLSHIGTAAAVVPTTAEEAMDMGNGWPESMIEEFMTLVEMGTFTYHKRSEVLNGEKLLKSKWVFKDKGDRKKARLVAAGYLQRFGMDFFESYSAVVASESFRVGIALNAFTGHDLR
jgi:histone deacetylase 1/2